MNSSSLRQGLYFGANSGVITTTGLLAGVSQSTNNPLVIIISLVSLAISDGISEAYSLYISKKAENPGDSSNGPLLSFGGVVLTKISIVLSFMLPFIFSRSLKYYKNLVWPLSWSIFLLIAVDYKLIQLRDEKILDYLIPQILLILLVVLSTKLLGNYISTF
jgi:hypothetical protein